MTANVNRGLAWIGVASSLVGVLDIVAILVILNFWVTPEEYGIAVKCIWIFPILDQATDLGLSAAVIQRDDHTEAKISTVFWINLTIALFLFALIVLTAPILATELYGHAIVGYMLIAYGTKLVWQNIYFIPVAMMKRELRFKELSVIRIIANIAEFAGKVGFAAAGFGIWCFVLGPLARVLVTGIGAQIRYPWRPRLICRLRDAKDYVTFGLRSSGSQLLFYFYTNIDFPIVGYYFGDHALGVYRLACEVVLEPVRILSNIIVDIAFPAFARLRHHRERLIAQFVSFVKLNLITVMSYSLVVLIAADDVISVLFPDYAEAAPAIQILAIVAVMRAVSYVMPPLLDGVGRPDRTLRYMTTAAIVLPIMYNIGALVFGDHVGYLGVPIAWAIGYPLAFAVLIYFALHTLDWTAGAFTRSVLGVLLCLGGAGVVALGVHFVLGSQSDVVRLVATAVVYVVVMALLLAYTQGLSLRSVKRSLAGDS
jgi:O-antigen/teichoic acid export membrane protein